MSEQTTGLFREQRATALGQVSIADGNLKGTRKVTSLVWSCLKVRNVSYTGHAY